MLAAFSEFFSVASVENEFVRALRASQVLRSSA